MHNQKSHWENIYKTKSEKGVSWYKPRFEKSLEIISSLGLPKDAEIMDVGGGASTLPDDLLGMGFKNITVLDISGEALNVSKHRMGDNANSIRWLEADITTVKLKPNHYDLWHDRALFHFLTKPEDRLKYINSLSTSLKTVGHVLMATFGPQGPLKCSGLEILRYSADSLQKELGRHFRLEQHFTEIHRTSFDTTQEFLYSLFRKS